MAAILKSYSNLRFREFPKPYAGRCATSLLKDVSLSSWPAHGLSLSWYLSRREICVAAIQAVIAFARLYLLMCQIIADFRYAFFSSPQGGTNNPGFIFILHNLATHPASCTNVCTPSKILIWQKPISLINSNRACSLNPPTVFVTRNIVLTISWQLYPRPHSSCNPSRACSTLHSQHAFIIACTFTGCGESTTRKTFSPLTKPKPA